MVWRGIGPRGFRTKQIKFTENVIATAYQKSLEEHKIFEIISNVFGEKGYDSKMMPHLTLQKTHFYLFYQRFLTSGLELLQKKLAGKF